MSEKYKKEAVKIYLEQIKVLTALASALFITPGFAIVLLSLGAGKELSVLSKTLASVTVSISSLLFLTAIFLTYFIYSSIVGRINAGEYSIERDLTVTFSKLHFYIILAGSFFYLAFIIILIFS